MIRTVHRCPPNQKKLFLTTLLSLSDEELGAMHDTAEALEVGIEDLAYDYFVRYQVAHGLTN